MIEFSSAFGERISGFLNYRIARGFKLETYIRHFIKFDRWCQNEQTEQRELTEDLVHKCISDSEASVHETSQRITVMRMFGIYLCAVGENAYVLPEKYISYGSKFTPPSTGLGPTRSWMGSSPEAYVCMIYVINLPPPV